MQNAVRDGKAHRHKEHSECGHAPLAFGADSGVRYRRQGCSSSLQNTSSPQKSAAADLQRPSMFSRRRLSRRVDSQQAKTEGYVLRKASGLGLSPKNANFRKLIGKQPVRQLQCSQFDVPGRRLGQKGSSSCISASSVRTKGSSF